MLKNCNFMILLACFGCYFGIFNGISIILSYLLEPWFGGDDLPMAVAAVGASPIVSGILGVMILGPMQRKSGVFKKWIVICMAGNLFYLFRINDCHFPLLSFPSHKFSFPSKLYFCLQLFLFDSIGPNNA